MESILRESMALVATGPPVERTTGQLDVAIGQGDLVARSRRIRKGGWSREYGTNESHRQSGSLPSCSAASGRWTTPWSTTGAMEASNTSGPQPGLVVLIGQWKRVSACLTMGSLLLRVSLWVGFHFGMGHGWTWMNMDEPKRVLQRGYGPVRR